MKVWVASLNLKKWLFHAYTVFYYTDMCQLMTCVCYRVKLAVNSETQEAVAVKIINLERMPQAEDNVRKEVPSLLHEISLEVYNEKTKLIIKM